MDDCTIILLGATGDLAKRKIIPALYRLFSEKKVAKLLVVAAARDTVTTTELLARSQPFIGHFDEQIWQLFTTCFVYQRVDVMQPNDFATLADLVNAQEKMGNLSGRRLLYCSLSSTLFAPVTELATKAGLIQRKEVTDPIWHRVAYEKPFGHDSASAQALNEFITQHLAEHQIYRIDHYLTKELVLNIALLRCANAIFEPLWNARGIEQVHITLSEDAGLAGRAAFYDSYGTMRDVMQNHMLELLALIAMEIPERLHGHHLCKARANVLQAAHVTDGIRGQCERYHAEDGVPADSKTETFALLRIAIENERWSGVPFYLKAGKYLDKHETVIRIKFRPSPFAHLVTNGQHANWLTLKMAPEEIFSLSLNVKKPGHTHDLISVPLEFCHSCVFSVQSLRAYELLLDEIIHGERSATVSAQEIMEAWRIIDDAYAQHLPLYVYASGTQGPEQIYTFAHHHHME